MSDLTLQTPSAQDRRPAGALGDALGEWLRGLPVYGLIAAAVWIPYQVLQAVLALALGVPAAGSVFEAAGKAAAADQPFDESGAVAAAGRLALFGVATLLLALLASSLTQAAIALAVTSRRRGEPTGPGRALAAGWKRTGAVLGATLLLSLIGLAAVVVVLVIGVPLTFALGFAHLAPVGTGLTALAMIAVPVFAISGFAVAPQVAAIEATGPVEALRRARRLVGTHVLAALLVMVVLGSLTWLGAALLASLLQSLAGGSTTASLLSGAAAAALAAVVFGPLPQVGLTLLYDRLRAQNPA